MALRFRLTKRRRGKPDSRHYRQYAGHDVLKLKHKLPNYVVHLMISTRNEAGIGYQCCDDLASIEKIYAMRKKAVGLLGNAKVGRNPFLFVELLRAT